MEDKSKIVKTHIDDNYLGAPTGKEMTETLIIPKFTRKRLKSWHKPKANPAKATWKFMKRISEEDIDLHTELFYDIQDLLTEYQVRNSKKKADVHPQTKSQHLHNRPDLWIDIIIMRYLNKRGKEKFGTNWEEVNAENFYNMEKCPILPQI